MSESMTVTAATARLSELVAAVADIDEADPDVLVGRTVSADGLRETTLRRANTA